MEKDTIFFNTYLVWRVEKFILRYTVNIQKQNIQKQYLALRRLDRKFLIQYSRLVKTIIRLDCLKTGHFYSAQNSRPFFQDTYCIPTKCLTSNYSIAKQMHVSVEWRKITALQWHLLRKKLQRNGMPALSKNAVFVKNVAYMLYLRQMFMKVSAKVDHSFKSPKNWNVILYHVAQHLSKIKLQNLGYSNF